MGSSFAAPLVVKADGTSSMLKKVPLTGEGAGTYSEAWLQDLLYGHADSLPFAEFDASFAGAKAVCRELETGSGPADVIYITKDGRPVIVEAKLWRNPEARRKVIGQILDYATALSRWDFDQFDAAVRKARTKEDGGKPKGLLELAGLAANSPEAATYRDGLSRSLQRGDMLLLIVGDGIREGAGAIAGFLERYGSLHFTFGLVEMAVYEMADGARLVQPRVLAQSEIARRIVVELVDGAMQLRAPEPELDEEVEVGPDVSAQLKRDRERWGAFWVTFMKGLVLTDGEQPLSPPAKSTNQYFQMPDATNAWVSAYLYQSKNRAGTYLTFRSGPTGDRLYEALKAEQDAVNRELGIPVVWESDGKKHWISSYETYSGSLVEDHGEEIRKMMADRVNRFVSVFRPRLARLAKGV